MFAFLDKLEPLKSYDVTYHLDRFSEQERVLLDSGAPHYLLLYATFPRRDRPRMHEHDPNCIEGHGKEVVEKEEPSLGNAV